MKYIGYIRVSTKKQGKSGLGLEAQKRAIRNLLNEDDILIAEFEEVESGKNKERPKLLEAIQKCKETKATLVIARLDRLSRSLSFISQLMDSGIEFVACDMKHANRFTIQIFAALAEQEARFISKRTKVALAELKAKGVRLGSPQNLNDRSRKRSLEVRQNNSISNEHNRKATALIVSMRKEDKSYLNIAKELNQSGFKTRRNKEFSAMTVKRLYDRYIANSEEQTK